MYLVVLQPWLLHLVVAWRVVDDDHPEEHHLVVLFLVVHGHRVVLVRVVDDGHQPPEEVLQPWRPRLAEA